MEKDGALGERELWERFCSTGRVRDYLALRGAEELSAQEELWETPDDSDRRFGD